MAGYRIISLIQGIIALFLGLTVLDAGDIFGMNAAFGFVLTGWWSMYAFWAYLIALIALLQIAKAITVRERD
ncbi:MAG: hypothetical protein GOP50_05715 [Candidatus Heimdallarchaeota archaeon]|nr:hypothetical protein [Candidatus Heimdallarchaeota archaeon]